MPSLWTTHGLRVLVWPEDTVCLPEYPLRGEASGESRQGWQAWPVCPSGAAGLGSTPQALAAKVREEADLFLPGQNSRCQIYCGENGLGKTSGRTSRDGRVPSLSEQRCPALASGPYRSRPPPGLPTWCCLSDSEHCYFQDGRGQVLYCISAAEVQISPQPVSGLVTLGQSSVSLRLCPSLLQEALPGWLRRQGSDQQGLTE